MKKLLNKDINASHCKIYLQSSSYFLNYYQYPYDRPADHRQDLSDHEILAGYVPRYTLALCVEGSRVATYPGFPPRLGHLRVL